ncbi:MAG TPA: beta-ketothiolase BktB [Solirubrobacterales bacterium]|nr:beta-ketothiolase BktB [Solirubrobacterales bacterium]
MDAIIASVARTPVGSYGRSLRDVPATELGRVAASAAIERAGIEPTDVEQTIFGNVIHTDPADMYLGRVVAIEAGVPKESPALTVNRLCGSGTQAIVSAAQSIALGDTDVALAGGAESMSRGPYWSPAARWGARMGDMTMVDPVVGVLTDPFGHVHMGSTAENLARDMDISREDQDAFAAESHRRAREARDAGRFERQIVPVEVPGRRGATTTFATDEHIRDQIDPEALAALRPAFEADGTVTAGNASGMNDAGAAVVLMSSRRAAELGVAPRARILAYAISGVEPSRMGIGPVPAIRKTMERAGRTLDEVGVIELNEAFAAQALAVIRRLDLDPARVNPNGGAIALGHPLGATGALITAKAVEEMERADHELGLVSLCIGGGQGIALLLGREAAAA